MSIRCYLTVDNDPQSADVLFQAVPRVGESIEMLIEDNHQVARVSRVVHRLGETSA